MVTLDNALTLVVEEKDRFDKANEADSDVEDVTPINPQVNASLNDLWKRKYGIPLHPSKENWSRKLHSNWKKLKHRTGQAEHVKGIPSLEDEPSREALGQNKRKFEWGPNFQLVDKTKLRNANETVYYAQRNPWLWLAAF